MMKTLRIASVQTEILADQLRNTSAKQYRYSNLFGVILWYAGATRQLSTQLSAPVSHLLKEFKAGEWGMGIFSRNS
jgi:hypothetical protein